MAIRSFKDIIDNKGYRINSKDRKIFERGDLQSFFGFSKSDAIEFVVYDVNDNQLPQKDGSLVRYIPMTSDNIRDYFLIADGTLLQSFNFPSEYFIDVERLLRDAGYNNGIFKTQITLINKRVGSNIDGEQLWISEISPSRTEVRLLPLITDANNQTELYQRYTLMVSGEDFKEDTLPYVTEFVNKISPLNILSFLKLAYGEDYYNEFKTEFGIQDLDTLLTQVYNKFVEAVFYEYTNRISSIRDIRYGQPKPDEMGISLSREKIKDTCIYILTEVIDYYLPQRNVTTQTGVDVAIDPSLDKISSIIQTRQSDTQYNAPTPVITPRVSKTGTTTPGVGSAQVQQRGVQGL